VAGAAKRKKKLIHPTPHPEKGSINDSHNIRRDDKACGFSRFPEKQKEAYYPDGKQNPLKNPVKTRDSGPTALFLIAFDGVLRVSSIDCR
jgi:hypothetical protein